MRNSIVVVNPPPARQSGGFTLVELLVVIGIIAILAGVALGPITSGIKKAKESAAMQSCRSIGLGGVPVLVQRQQWNLSRMEGRRVILQGLLTGNYIS